MLFQFADTEAGVDILIFLVFFSYHLRKVDSSEVPPFASEGLDLYSISAQLIVQR